MITLINLHKQITGSKVYLVLAGMELCFIENDNELNVDKQNSLHHSMISSHCENYPEVLLLKLQKRDLSVCNDNQLLSYLIIGVFCLRLNRYFLKTQCHLQHRLNVM